MEADVLISEGEPVRGYFVFLTGEGQIRTAELISIAERF
jgi:hypothetical protein